MDILYLLIPLSAVLVLVIVGLFGWAVQAGQFEELEGEGARALAEDAVALDERQVALGGAPQQS